MFVRLTLALGLVLLTTNPSLAGGCCKMMRVPVYQAPLAPVASYGMVPMMPMAFPAAFGNGMAFSMQASMSGDPTIMLPLLARVGERLFGAGGLTSPQARELIQRELGLLLTATGSPELKLLQQVLFRDMKEEMKKVIREMADELQGKKKPDMSLAPSQTPEQKRLREEVQQLAKAIAAGQQSSAPQAPVVAKTDSREDVKRLLAEIKAGQKTDSKSPVVVGRK